MLRGLLTRDVDDEEGEVLMISYNSAAIEAATQEHNLELRKAGLDDDELEEIDEDEEIDVEEFGLLDGHMRTEFRVYDCSEPVGTELLLFFANWKLDDEDEFLAWRTSASFATEDEIDVFKKVRNLLHID